MADEARLLYGRDPLLRSLMPRLTGLAYAERARVRWEPRPDPPVVLVTGQHGMGRSAVLEDLASQYAGRLPFAYVRALPPDQRSAGPRQDGAPRTASSLVELLQELVCGLAPGLPVRYPLRRASARHPFRVLLPGLVAVSGWQPGDADERDGTCLRLARTLTACGLGGKNPRELGRTWAAEMDPPGGGHATEHAAGDAAEEAAEEAGDDAADDSGSGGSGDDAARRRLTQGLVEKFAELCPIGPAQDWYARQHGDAAAGTGSPGSPGSPTPLVRLGLRLHQGGDPGRAGERALVAAFLHDIAAAYGPLQRANRERWPLILLDDAHHPAGKHFIDLLLEQRAKPERPHDDHLVIAATHLGGVPEDAPEAVRCELPRLASATAVSDWRRQGPSPSAGLLVVPLTPLNRDEIFLLLDRADITPHHYLASAVHSLTDGHPAASRMLCDAVLAAARKKRRVTPASLLELRTTEGRPVTTAMLELLLPRQRQRHRLVQLCLARDRTAAEALAGHLGMRGPEQLQANAAADYLEAHHWQRYTTPDGPLVAHPLLQRLLIAEARRTMSADNGARWQDAHDFLVQHHLGPGNGGLEHAQWHSMAAGKALKVAGALEERFELGKGQRGGAGEWLTLLAYCATAPVPPSEDGEDDRPRTALGEHDPAVQEPGPRDEALLSVNRLLHALWCLSEPHTEPDAELLTVVREELGCLSRLHPTWRTELRHVARTWPLAAEKKRPFTAPTDKTG
jgi:hypothetical protein